MTWEPNRYLKFKEERKQPFRDLCEFIKTRPDLKVLDLGCGTGSLTVELASMLPNSSILGIDTSPEMLEKTDKSNQQVQFELKAIEDIADTWDLIFSHSALHWVNDHHSLFPKLFSMLRPGGQIVFQFPSRHRNKAHRAINDVCREDPFVEVLKGWTWDFPVLEMDTYAEILFAEGAEEITIWEKVYPHILADPNAVLEWVTSTTLTIYLEHLPQELHEPFKQRCKEKFYSLWPCNPVLFPFRRVLLSAIKPDCK